MAEGEVTSTAQGTRVTGAVKKENQIQIALLGGSTTFGTGVSDADTWAFLLQQKLGDTFHVTNFGMPGYSTVEGIIQMALIVPEFHPDYVVFLEGWNDIRNYHNPDFSADYFSHGMSQYTSLEVPVTFQALLRERLAIIKGLHVLRKKFFRHHGNLNLPDNPLYNQNDPEVDRIYRRNIRTLILLSEKRVAHLIFIPQILNAQSFRGKKGAAIWSPYIRIEAMGKLMKSFNQIVAEECDAESGCTYLEKIEKEIWENNDFVDDGHFSRKGGEKFSQLLSEYFLKTVSSSEETGPLP